MACFRGTDACRARSKDNDITGCGNNITLSGAYISWTNDFEVWVESNPPV